MQERHANPILSGLKQLVSRKKNRLQTDGYDLDLSYITENIIAMGFPSEEIESLYRNRMEDVQSYFQKKHLGHYKIYNLCQERKYSSDKFQGRVAEYPFEDHNPPAFAMLLDICQDIHNYLAEHRENVVGIHCKAGKGRTGVVICCYLLFEKVFQSPEEVIAFFAKRRTADYKGVTIPSQLRYITYFAKAMSEGLTKQVYQQKCITTLVSLAIITIPEVSMIGGCRPFFKVRSRTGKIFDSRKALQVKRFVLEAKAVFQPLQVRVEADFEVEVFHQSVLKQQLLFSFWLNSYFCRREKLLISKRMLDGLHKQDKEHFSDNLHVELNFAEP